MRTLSEIYATLILHRTLPSLNAISHILGENIDIIIYIVLLTYTFNFTILEILRQAYKHGHFEKRAFFCNNF